MFHPTLLWIAVSISLLVSCSVHQREPVVLDIALQNATSIDLDWMKVDWDGPYVPGGIVPRGKSKTTLGAEPPKSDSATITFVEDVGRQPHTIKLDVSRLKTLRSGHYRVTLSVSSLTEAKLVVDEHTK